VKSAGNDIVALNAIDIQRTNNSGFYSKFITASEQSLYSQDGISAMPFENFTWLLWSVKESVYKYLKRTDTSLIFSPAKIIIQNIDAPNSINEPIYTGKVLYQSVILYFRSKVNNDFIASVVNDTEGFEDLYWGIQSIDKSDSAYQSKMVREAVLNKLNTLLAVDDLQIEKNATDCPVLVSGKKIIDIPVSLAHHGNFVAYSFVIN
jgi:phosphopantetheinyl transferase (holo-ACP synthase)